MNNSCDALCESWVREVERCPFCFMSEHELLYFIHPDNNPRFYVSCSRCHASGPECTTPNEAVKKWNHTSIVVWGKK